MGLMFYIRRMRSYFLNAAGRPNFFGKLAISLFIVVLAKLASHIFSGFIESTMKRRKRTVPNIVGRRIDTIADLLKKTGKVLVYFYAILMVLETFHIDTKSILATAGIGGVAIGFGAQSLVKDVIAGFFVIQENSYIVGDHVKLQNFEGIIEEMSLRTTKIRDYNGDLHILTNGYIEEITNRSRGAQRALVLVSIAYEESIDGALAVLKKACQAISDQHGELLESGPNVDGVENLNDYSVDIRITAMAKSGYHWDIERIIRKTCKEYLEAADIEIPYPKLEISGGEER